MGRDLEAVFSVRRRGQHPGLKLGGAPHLLGALGDHALEPGDARPVLHLQAPAAQVVDDQQVELCRAHRLHVVRVSAVLERGRPELGVVDARDHHHGRVRPHRSELLEQPIARLVRKPDVEEHDGIVVRLDQIPRLGRAQRDVALKPPAPQRPCHDARQGLLVVDHQHSPAALWCAHGQQV